MADHPTTPSQTQKDDIMQANFVCSQSHSNTLFWPAKDGNTAGIGSWLELHGLDVHQEVSDGLKDKLNTKA